MEDGMLLLRVDLSTEEDETVRLPQARLERGPAAADHDLFAYILHNLEMVREPQALVKFGNCQLGRVPKVIVGARRLVVALLKYAVYTES